MRAVASYWSGIFMTTVATTAVTTQATSSAGQRYFHMPRTAVRNCCRICSITYSGLAAPAPRGAGAGCKLRTSSAG